MIPRERGLNERPRHDAAVDGPRPLDDLAEPDHRRLRGIDDPEYGLHALLSDARHRDRRVGKLRTPDSTASRPLHQVAKPPHEVVEASPVRVVERGSHEASLAERD